MEDDARIIGLFEQRSEQAIAAVSGKYGGLCRSIAGRILSDTQDVEECVNDTWLRLWNAIPPCKTRFSGRVYYHCGTPSLL